MPQIIVNIDANGDVKVEAAGVVGKDCQALTRAIEQQLGAVAGDQKKPEFHQQQKQTQKARQ